MKPEWRLASIILAMHSIAAANRPRLPETEPKWFESERSGLSSKLPAMRSVDESVASQN